MNTLIPAYKKDESIFLIYFVEKIEGSYNEQSSCDSEMQCSLITLRDMTYTAPSTDRVNKNITANSVVKNAVMNELIDEIDLQR